ncbi:unnamed protein product [Cuscuta epithymum]|uniref:Uncharacterized protein n=1 Tax=Cuscuta epithymum TaxID=186058 RepID=A0AAV0EKU3_9ASTE|nr:unnamed protein product [Cuscuta epithymum]CAH9124034.1 unnamed protein product [Cuscuta epithymum]
MSEPSSSPASTDRALESVESVYARAQSFLNSLPKKPLTSLSDDVSCEMQPLFKGHATFAKEIFDKLLSYPLDDLADPKRETTMMESLSILSDNLSLFTDGQAKKIMDLRASFPQIMHEWRDSIKVKESSEQICSTFEKTKSLLEDLVKREEEIKRKLKYLSDKEEELEAHLKVIESSRGQLKEEREEVSKQTKQVCSLAMEQARKVEAKKMDLDRANKKMDNLKSEFDATRHLFI